MCSPWILRGKEWEAEYCCSVGLRGLRQCLCVFISHSASQPRKIAITLRVGQPRCGDLPKLAWYWRQVHRSSLVGLQPAILSSGQCTEPCCTVAELS